jgi:hypothetical protein
MSSSRELGASTTAGVSLGCTYMSSFSREEMRSYYLGGDYGGAYGVGYLGESMVI